MSDLTGKVALVTGGSRGIGAAVAKRLADSGAAVALTYVQAADQAREVANALTALGVETELVAITTAGDRGADPASDPAGVKGLFVTEIVRALGDGEVELAVHSAKDLPAGIEAEDEHGLVIAAVPERASALDGAPAATIVW